ILDLYQKHPEPTHGSASRSKSDETVRIGESKLIKTPPDTGIKKKPSRPPEPPSGPKPAVGRYSPLKPGGFSSAATGALAASDTLRIAQTRSLELDQELSRLRTDNEQLAAAGETLRRRADELATQAKTLQTRLTRTTENKDQEIEILRNSQTARDKEVGAL